MKHSNFAILPGTFVLQMILLVAACQPGDGVTIGFIGELTGRQSTLGLAARNAAVLAVEDLNDAGGLLGMPLTLETFDGGGTLDETIEGLTGFLAKAIRIVVGPMTSNTIPAVLDPRFNEILFLSPTISSDILSERRDNIIRYSSDTKIQGRTAARLVRELGITRLAVFLDSSNSEYTGQVLESLKTDLAETGTQIFEVAYQGGSNPNYSAIARTAASLNPDGYFALSSGFDAGRLVQAVLPETVQFIICEWAGTRDFIEIGGRPAEGAYLARNFLSNTPSSRLQHFNSRYLGRFGYLPDFSSKYTYEAIMHLAAAVNAAGSASPASLLPLLHSSTVEGFDESYTIDEFGDAHRSQTYAVVTRGVFVTHRFAQDAAP